MITGTIIDSESGRVLGTINLDEPIPEYTADDFYKMSYKRWRMIRRAEKLLLPRRFKGFSVKIKKCRFAYFSNNK